MRGLEALAPAKLNLFLHVTGRRKDGYHELQTLFQLLDWGDRLRFEINQTPGITLKNSPEGICVTDNLIYRAAALLLPPEAGVTITCDKRIPMGGGLGGGSSDAATTLLAINQLFHLGRSPQQLGALGLSLGADVPVFVHGCSAWAEGIGEQLTPVTLPESWYVIVHPACHISTVEIFTDPQLTRNTPAITMSAVFAGQARNDLEKIVASKWPAVRDALEWLGRFGAAKMTGSGACVFVSVATEQLAREIAGQVPSPWRGYTARGINRVTQPVPL